MAATSGICDSIFSGAHGCPAPARLKSRAPPLHSLAFEGPAIRAPAARRRRDDQPSQTAARKHRRGGLDPRGRRWPRRASEHPDLRGDPHRPVLDRSGRDVHRHGVGVHRRTLGGAHRRGHPRTPRRAVSDDEGLRSRSSRRASSSWTRASRGSARTASTSGSSTRSTTTTTTSGSSLRAARPRRRTKR